MSLDGEAQSIVSALADTFGKPVTLVRVEEVYDPGTGSTTTVETDVPATALPPRDFTTFEVEGTLIQSNDTVIDVPAEGLDMTSTGGGGSTDPQQTDKVKIDGVVWSIVRVGRAYGGEEVAVWRLHLRN